MTLPLGIGRIGCKVGIVKPQVVNSDQNMGEAVCDNIGLAGNILNVCSKFWYVGQLVLLTGGPRLEPLKAEVLHNKVQDK